MSLKAFFITASLGIASLVAVAPASAQPDRREARTEHRIPRGEGRRELRLEQRDRRIEHRIEHREWRRDGRREHRIERHEHDRRWR